MKISNRIPLIVGGQHGLKAGISVPLYEVFADVQRNALDSGIGGGQAANAAPLPGKVVPLRLRKPLGGLLEPEVNVGLVHMLLHKAAFVYERHNGAILHAVLDGVLVNQLAELRHGIFLLFHQRRPGKADIAAIGEHRPHLGGQQAIVGAVTLVHQQEHVPRKILVLQFFGGVELVDDGGDHIRLPAL